jgi:4-hydroxy-2-oxoheptanedioate aldolase
VSGGAVLRARLDAGEVVFGCFSLLVEAPFVEMLGRAGFDFVLTDCEEVPGDSYGRRLEDLVRAADAVDLATLVRPVENVPGAINRALNTGAQGIFVPHVRSAREAEEVVQAARYPPRGRRGAAPVIRAAGFGSEPWADYHARVERENLVFVMVEDQEAVANIEEITAVDGIDGVLVGTWDLAVEMGHARYGPPAPPVMALVERVIEATRAAGLVMAAHGWSADAAARYVELGCQVLIVSLDSTLALQGLRELRELAERVEAAS